MALTREEISARYKARHPEKFTADARREKRKESDKRYREKAGPHPANVTGTDAYKKYRASEKYRRTSMNAHLKRKYGISFDDYDAMLTKQGGACMICGSTDSGREWKDGRVQRMKLFVDHCHKTGVVRGLLCNNCNVGLAQFKDSPEILNKAISYLIGFVKEN